VGNGEERLRVRSEHGLLLGEVFHSDREDRSLRRGGVAEASDVRLAERALPREALAGDRPGAVAVTLALGDLWQRQGQPSDLVDTHHAGPPYCPRRWRPPW